MMLRGRMTVTSADLSGSITGGSGRRITVSVLQAPGAARTHRTSAGRNLTRRIVFNLCIAERKSLHRLVRRAFGRGTRADQHELVHRPRRRGQRRQRLRRARFSQQRDVRGEWATVEDEFGAVELEMQALHQCAERRRRLARPHPQDVVVAPEMRLFDRQDMPRAPRALRRGGGRRRVGLAEEREREVNVLFRDELAAGDLTRRLAPFVESRGGARRRPGGEEKPQSSMSATASAAMPSPRPMKPSCSVVVALMLTAPGATPRSAAILPTMRAMCGAMRGVSATMVASTLTI